MSYDAFTICILGFAGLLVGSPIAFVLSALMFGPGASAMRRAAARRRRQEELARVRAGETETAFARLFPARQGEAARAVYRYLTGRLAVVRDLPLRPDDSLAELFGVYTPDGPTIEAVVRVLCGRLHVGSAYLPVELPSPRTVGELVHAAAGFAERPARLSLLRAAERPTSADALLRPASGSAADPTALLRAAPRSGRRDDET